MAKVGKLLIQLVLLAVTLSLTATIALAGCCVPLLKEVSEPIECIPEGYPVDDVEPYMMSEERCTELWSAQECDTIIDCQTGCCCEPNDLSGTMTSTYTSRNGCSASADWTADPSPGHYGVGNRCDALCNQGTATYAVSGTVYDPEGSPAAGATVEFDTPALTYTTSADGSYAFTGRTAGYHPLKATWTNDEGKECEGRLAIELNTDTTGADITLDCEEQGPTTNECKPVWQCTHEEGPDHCNDYYDECIDINPDPDCEKQPWPGALPYDPCGSVGPTCDPDNGLDADGVEQCDYTNTAQDRIVFRDGEVTCADYGYAGGAIGCTECRVDTSGCDPCPANPQSCSRTQCDTCAACQASEYCDFNVCEEEAPTDLQANAMRGRAAAQVEWRFDSFCEQSVIAYNILICHDQTEDGTCQGTDDTIELIRGIDDNDDVFLNIPHRYTYDANGAGLEEHTEYCFRIQAVTQETPGVPITTTSENAACITTGDQPCMELCDEGDTPEECSAAVKGSMCHEGGYGFPDNSILKCDQDNNLYLFQDCGNLLCGGNEGNPVCQNTQQCEYCNALFGMYGYYALDPNKQLIVPYYDTEREGYIAMECNDQEYFQYRPVNGANPPGCYYERTMTVADHLTECDGIASCYDYKNKISCEDSVCSQGLECTWRPLIDDWGQSLDDQFGLGVCIPQDPSIDDLECERCDEDTSMFPACTDKLCGLYGPAQGVGCFYVEGEQGGCKVATDIECADYTTQDDCGTTPVTVDVSYVPGTDRREGGTHEINPRSNDRLGLGGCEWVRAGAGYDCIKNTDGYAGMLGYQEDCTKKERETFTYCSKDFTPPNTTIDLFTAEEQNEENQWHTEDHPVYSLARPFGIAVADNLFPNDALQSWFGIGDDYPSLSKEDLLLMTNLTGPTTITYYSKDPSENLEVIDQVKVYFDNEPPAFDEGTFELSNNSYMIGDNTGNDWRTDLNITYTFTDDHDPIRCDTRLVMDTNELNGDREGVTFSTGTPVQNRYTYLQDGVYEFRISCTDHPFLGNEQNTTKVITVEADSRITNPSPRRERLNTRTVTISIETQTQARCEFSDLTTMPVSLGGEDFETEDNTHHHYQLTNLEHGLYHYHVGCTFEDGTVVEGNPSDSILFSVDLEPPEVTFIDRETGEPYDPDSYTDAADLTIACMDQDPELQYTYFDAKKNERVIIWDGNAGAETSIEGEEGGTTMTWCFTPVATQCAQAQPLPPSGRFDLTDEDVAGGNYFSYSCSDRYNTGTGSRPLFIKNLDVAIDEVYICTKDGNCYDLTGPKITP